MTYLQDINTIQYYRDSIMKSLSEIDESRYKIGLIKRSDLNRVINMTEAYSVMCNIRGVFLCESEMFTKSVERLVKEYKYRIKTLNEGFENPFDDDDTIDIDTRYEDQCDVEPEGSVKIKKIGLWNDNTNSKVNYMDGKIVSGQFFAPNDTIEICPVRIIHPSDMYSKAVREFTFDIDPERNLYGIPFGYASYYRSNLDCNLEPNADYEYIDGANKSIRIYATRPIKKGNEIVLQASRDMYDNEFNDSDFRYDKEPFYSIKNVTVV